MLGRVIRRSLVAIVALALAGCATTTAATTGIWTKVALSHPPFITVSCPSATACVLTTSSGPNEVFNGHRLRIWSATMMPDDPGCRAAEDCLVTSDCPTLSFCAAADGNGNAFTRVDGTWSTPAPADADDCRQADSACTLALSCPDANFCRAVDSNGYAFAYLNGVWTRAKPVADFPEFQAISCPTVSFCVAVDMDYDLYVDRGPGWKPAGELSGTTPAGGSEPPVPQAISCARPTLCVAVDNFGSYFTFNGQAWSDSRPFSTIENEPDTVSCGSSLCVLNDEVSGLYVYNGSGSPVRLRDGEDDLVDASCPTAGVCVAIDRAGGLFVEQLKK